MSGVVGVSVPRLEDDALIRGAGRFVDDIQFPETLHASFVRSQHAHALIHSIDTGVAQTIEGVVAVWTLKDVLPYLADRYLRVALPSPAYLQELHRPILAGTETVHVGEAIAVVFAHDAYIAEDAADQIVVTYEELPAVNDCRKALEPGSPPVHQGGPGNLVARFELSYGNAREAVDEAPVVIRDSFRQHRGLAHSMETRGVLARYDDIDEKLTVWSSTQTPHAGKRVLCEMLGLDEDRLRVVTPDVGGGFGPKLVFYPEEALIALAALKLKRPVKWIEDRREHAVATTQERDQIWDMELALDRDGHILALSGVLIHEHGAYTARGVNVPYGSGAAITLPYVVPSYYLDIKLALTNKVAVTPIRGAGQPQAVFVIERLLDQAAAVLELDRAEIRRRNLVPPERMPYKTPLRTRGGMQVVLDSGDYPACMNAALEKANWDGFEARRAAAFKQGRRIGIGLAVYVEGTGRGPFEPVQVRVAENGRIHVATGAAAMGQSTKTMLAQVVAEQLGGDMSNVVVVAGDTAAIELGMGGFNSRQAVMAGSSAHAAALKVRDKALKVASHMLDVGVQALEIVGRHVRIRGEETRSVGLADIARALAGLPGYYVPGGVEPGLEAMERVIINDMTYANGAAVVEVEVDADTGGLRIEHVVFAHDCGRMLNPRIVEGQIIGGIAHGIGNACLEQMLYDDAGQPLTTTLADYLLVSATEMPPRIDILHLESPTYLNALGIKGVGESGVIPMAAAIASAIDHALSDFGVIVRNVPITPPQIVALIEECTPT